MLIYYIIAGFFLYTNIFTSYSVCRVDFTGMYACAGIHCQPDRILSLSRLYLPRQMRYNREGLERFARFRPGEYLMYCL